LIRSGGRRALLRGGPQAANPSPLAPDGSLRPRDAPRQARRRAEAGRPSRDRPTSRSVSSDLERLFRPPAAAPQGSIPSDKTSGPVAAPTRARRRNVSCFAL